MHYSDHKDYSGGLRVSFCFASWMEAIRLNDADTPDRRARFEARTKKAKMKSALTPKPSALNLLALTLTAHCSLAQDSQPKLLWRGTYYDHPEIVSIDQTTRTARVALYGDAGPARADIPLRNIPQPFIDAFSKSQKKGSVADAERRLDATAAKLKARVEQLWRWHESQPEKPWIIRGKILSIISDSEVLVTCEKDEAGIPAAEGTIYLAGYAGAASKVDGDPVKIAGTLTGRHEYGTAVGKRTVRAYRALPGVLATIPPPEAAAK